MRNSLFLYNANLGCRSAARWYGPRIKAMMGQPEKSKTGAQQGYVTSRLSTLFVPDVLNEQGRLGGMRGTNELFGVILSQRARHILFLVVIDHK